MWLGRVSGIYGTRGWIKLFSYTEPRDNIVAFDTWILEQHGEQRRIEVETGSSQGKTVLAKLRGIDDRDAARPLIGAQIGVQRGALPSCDPGEYYWTDLEGLRVESIGGDALGVVDHLVATGAHDVLVLGGDGRRMIPFVASEVVREVDLEGGVIVVDWDASYWDA